MFELFQIQMYGPLKPIEKYSPVKSFKKPELAQPPPPEETAKAPLRDVGPAKLRKPNCAAALALPKIGEKGAQCAFLVAKLTADRDPELRMASLQSLGEMGAKGQGYVL